MKNKFLQNLQPTQNRAVGFDNESTGEKKKVTLRIPRELNIRFKDDARTFFIQDERRDLEGYNNYLKIWILNVKEEFKKKYGEILTPDDRDFKFYTRVGRSVNQLDPVLYPCDNIKPLSIEFKDNYYRDYCNLMHTYFTNEMPEASNYSLTFFFHDLYRITDSLKLKFYEI